MSAEKEEVKHDAAAIAEGEQIKEAQPEAAEEKVQTEEEKENERIAEEVEKERLEDIELNRRIEAEFKGDESDDLIDLLDIYDTGQKLLNKLGINTAGKKDAQGNIIKPEKREKTASEIQHDKDKEEADKKQRDQANKMVEDAQKKLKSIKKTSDDLDLQVANLLKQVKAKDKALIVEEARTTQIKENHKKKMEQFRTNQIGEIFWLMKEQQNTHDDKDPYYFVIHSYLVQLYIEDHSQEALEPDINDKIKQVFAYFQTQFEQITKDCHTPEQFKKIMPKPEPKTDIQRQNYQTFLQEYYPWAQKHYEEWNTNDDDDDENNLLMTTQGASADFSSMVGSENEQSDLMNDQTDNKVDLDKVGAIKEEDED